MRDIIQLAAREDDRYCSHEGSEDVAETASIVSQKDVQAADDAAQASTSGVENPAQLRRVLRKIDFWMMPIMSLVYMLQYIDKSAMSYAAVYTFREDRNLSSRDYSWLGTCFYLGYLFFEPIGGWLFHHVKTSRFVSLTIVIWGGLVMAMAIPQNLRGLLVVRTLLGAAESIVTPAFALITARFYTRDEQPLRFAIWYSFNGFGSMIGGLLGYGVGFINNTRIYNWAWIYILNGTITVLSGCGFYLICPDSPKEARFLTIEERQIALDRIKANQSSLRSYKTNWKQVREALNPWQDPQGWLFFLATFSITIPNGGLGNFFHLILQSYGYSPFQTILLGLPTGVVQVVAVVAGGYVARRYKDARIWVGIVGIAWCLLGLVVQYCTKNDGARLFGYYIIPCFIPGLAQLFSFPACNVTGYTKRVTVQAMIFIAYAGGNAIGPQLWHSDQNPPYRDGFLACIICFSCSIGLFIILRLYYVRENRRRDILQAGLDTQKEPDFSDLTDTENLNFRYRL